MAGNDDETQDWATQNWAPQDWAGVPPRLEALLALSLTRAETEAHEASATAEKIARTVGVIARSGVAILSIKRGVAALSAAPKPRPASDNDVNDDDHDRRPDPQSHEAQMYADDLESADPQKRDAAHAELLRRCAWVTRRLDPAGLSLDLDPGGAAGVPGHVAVHRASGAMAT